MPGNRDLDGWRGAGPALPTTQVNSPESKPKMNEDPQEVIRRIEATYKALLALKDAKIEALEQDKMELEAQLQELEDLLPEPKIDGGVHGP